MSYVASQTASGVGQQSEKPCSALFIGAHPDDIEFYMAGTLLLLAEAGFQIHYMTLASGSCGSLKFSADRTRSIRRQEAKRAAKVLGATFRPSLVDDLEVLYDVYHRRAIGLAYRLLGDLGADRADGLVERLDGEADAR